MNKAFLTILILVVALAIINLIPGLTKGLGNFVYAVFSPIERLFSNAGKGIINCFQVLISISELNTENLALKEKNIILETEIAELKTIKQENEVLKQALNISKAEQIKTQALSIGTIMQIKIAQEKGKKM